MPNIDERLEQLRARVGTSMSKAPVNEEVTRKYKEHIDKQNQETMRLISNFPSYKNPHVQAIQSPQITKGFDQEFYDGLYKNRKTAQPITADNIIIDYSAQFDQRLQQQQLQQQSQQYKQMIQPKQMQNIVKMPESRAPAQQQSQVYSSTISYVPPTDQFQVQTRTESNINRSTSQENNSLRNKSPLKSTDLTMSKSLQEIQQTQYMHLQQKDLKAQNDNAKKLLSSKDDEIMMKDMQIMDLQKELQQNRQRDFDHITYQRLQETCEDQKKIILQLKDERDQDKKAFFEELVKRDTIINQLENSSNAILLQQKNQEIVLLNSQISHMKQNLGDQVAFELREHNEQLKQRLRQIQKNVDHLEVTMSTNQTELHLKEMVITNLVQENNQLLQSQSIAENQLSNSRHMEAQRQLELESEIANYTCKITDLQQQLDNMQIDYEQIKSKCESHKSENVQLQKALQLEKASSLKYEQQLQQLNADYMKLNQDNLNLSQKLISQQSPAKFSDSANNALNTEIAELKQEIAHLSVQYTEEKAALLEQNKFNLNKAEQQNKYLQNEIQRQKQLQEQLDAQNNLQTLKLKQELENALQKVKESSVQKINQSQNAEKMNQSCGINDLFSTPRINEDAGQLIQQIIENANKLKSVFKTELIRSQLRTSRSPVEGCFKAVEDLQKLFD
ncbi:Hypothetical_protein [Hexamita inflata]|uniref:Hypothetical_protein n=1 Tax=Hexamita inflata TaxID=28002 RepID=A0AA86RQW3_9EUKA|nr:Hypothetical protein HINF_LOCUS58600 [Hexamita inflata]